MAIAFSGRPVIERFIRADDTAEEFVNAFALVLDQAGWAPLATVDPGYKYEITSKQDLKARFRVWADEEFTNRWHIQVSDESELAMSPEITLMIATDRVYRVIAGHCQAFLSLPTVTSNEAHEGVYGHNFAFGIPYVSEGELSTAVIPGECGVVRNEDVTANIWWLSAPESNPLFSDVRTLRGSLTCEGFGWRACRNGTIAGGNFMDPLCVLPLRHPMGVYYGPSQEITRWSNGDPLLLDPYVAWGDSTNRTRYRAQIYDAILASYHYEIESTITTTEPTLDEESTVEVEWISYSYTAGDLSIGEPGTYNGTLFLMRGDPPERSNYAY